MKIAFLIGNFPKMSEKFIVDQIIELINLGHEIDIFPVANPKEESMHQLISDYKLLDHTYYPPKPPKSKFWRRGHALQQILVATLKSPLKMSRALYILLFKFDHFSYEYLYRLLPILNRKYDIFHAHFGPRGNFGLFLKDVGIKGKLVVSFHGYDVTTYINSNGHKVYDRLFQSGDLFTYNSNATKEIINGLGCPDKQTIKIPMGIDLNEYQFTSLKQRPDSPIKLLSVGRLVEMKGREYAIKAVAKLVKTIPEVEYNIVGDGELYEELSKLCQELDVTNKIHLHGWISTEKLATLYQESHIMIHPSVKDKDGNMEGQGVVLVEAQAKGLIVIATNHNAFPETVCPALHNYLVQERNVDDLYNSLSKLIEHRDAWPELIQSARSYVEEKYDLKQITKYLDSEYQKLFN